MKDESETNLTTKTTLSPQEQTQLKAIKALVTIQPSHKTIDQIREWFYAYLKSDFSDSKIMRSEAVNTFEEVEIFFTSITEP